MGWNMVNVFDRGAGLCRIGGVPASLGATPRQAGSGPGWRVDPDRSGFPLRFKMIEGMAKDVFDRYLSVINGAEGRYRR